MAWVSSAAARLVVALCAAAPDVPNRRVQRQLRNARRPAPQFVAANEPRSATEQTRCEFPSLYDAKSHSVPEHVGRFNRAYRP